MINMLKKLTLVAAISTIAGVAVAATNPPGPSTGSSQGDFDITLNKQDLIVINNFDDMVLAQFIEDGPDGDYLGAQGLCVGRAGASGDTALGYAITASNSRSAFVLNNGGDPSVPGNNIGYQVYFDNTLKGVQQYTQGTELEHSMQNLSDFNTNLAETECAPGTTNSTLWVKANGAQIDSAAPGVFTDTVTVTAAVN